MKIHLEMAQLFLKNFVIGVSWERESERERERERDVLPMSYSSNEGYSTTHATWPKQILLAVSVEILFHYDKVQSSLV